jgi:hypothetical protein
MELRYFTVRAICDSANPICKSIRSTLNFSVTAVKPFLSNTIEKIGEDAGWPHELSIRTGKTYLWPERSFKRKQAVSTKIH